MFGKVLDQALTTLVVRKDDHAGVQQLPGLFQARASGLEE